MAVPNPYKLEADLNEFTLKVFKDGKQIDSIEIGVAKNNTPTPGGIYYTTELIKTPNPTATTARMRTGCRASPTR